MNKLLSTLLFIILLSGCASAPVHNQVVSVPESKCAENEATCKDSNPDKSKKPDSALKTAANIASSIGEMVVIVVAIPVIIVVRGIGCAISGAKGNSFC